MKPVKSQTLAQRVANPVWLRGQILELIHDCTEHIADDLALARKARDDARCTSYLASAESTRHWQRALERILRGATFGEEIAKALSKRKATP